MEHFTQTQKNIPSSYHLMELSPKLVTNLDTEQVSTDTRKFEITPCIISGHRALKPDIKNRNNRKFKNSWKLNNSLVNEY